MNNKKYTLINTKNLNYFYNIILQINFNYDYKIKAFKKLFEN